MKKLNEPNFEKLFPVEDEELGCEECSSWQLTPNMVSCLYQGAREFHRGILEDLDWHREEVERGDSEGSFYFEGYPQTTKFKELGWWEKVAESYQNLTLDFKAGKWPLPRCTSEEIALYMVIQDARNSPSFNFLPKNYAPHKDDTLSAEELEEMLLEDTDFLFLFQPKYDGIQNDAAAAQLGMVNLDTDDWFKPFREEFPVKRKKR